MNTNFNNIKYNNTKLKKIVNIYQQNYLNAKCCGIGDFLRGSVCLYQLCKLNNIIFEMDISHHPISKFIYIDTSNNNIIDTSNNIIEIDYNNISHYKSLNYIFGGKQRVKDSYNFYKKFIDDINNIDMEVYPLLCNSFPIWENTHIYKNFEFKILPTNIMRVHIKNFLNKYNLKKKQYNIIHIRNGDQYLIDKQIIDRPKVYKIINIIKYIRKNYNNKYVVISDCNDLKLILKKVFPDIIIHFNNISHLGNKNTDESYINTIIDFFLISYSSRVFNISSYEWGSGFSEWNAYIHNIPFKFYKI